MKYKHNIRVILTASVLALCTIFPVIGCMSEESLLSLSPIDQEPSDIKKSEHIELTAQEALEALLGIVFPDDVVIEDFEHGWIEQTELIKTQSFVLKLVINNIEFDDFELQIFNAFHQTRHYCSNGIVSEDDESITPPYIVDNMKRFTSDYMKVEWAYWRYVTGVPLTQEHKPFISLHAFTYVMGEENGERTVYFLYG